MTSPVDSPPVERGDWESADVLRQWSFSRRSPEQRLNWLVEMLEIGYQTGAIKHRYAPVGISELPVLANPVTNR